LVPPVIERLGRREQLLDQAAEVSRAGLRTRRERILASARPILHTSVAAAGAWLIAHNVLGHPKPFFAPVSAVVTLGLTVGERRRRAVELALGVAVGILIADLLVQALGTGTWQIAVIVGLAMTGATLVGGGPLLASQAGASAVLVATLQPPSGSFDFTRFVDALTGATVALVVSSLLLPVNPLHLLRESAGTLLRRFEAALEQIATALETREPAAADRALVAMARVDVAHDGLRRTLQTAGEVARLSPARRGTLGELDRYAVAAGELGFAVENVRALARGAIRSIDLDDEVPDAAVQAVRALALCARELRRYLDTGDAEPAGEAGGRAAALANSVLEATGNLSAVHIVGQIRLAAVDLLRATGMERAQAQEVVRTATRA
jgi:uncharacterized membrane protein YgaE (UPF0421/DUF939 family)